MEREQLFEVARRTFDTPEFRGIEFIEVEAKSVINHVPGKYLPFNWTINPYRGCSHACSFCQSGDTPILIGDGRWKGLADVRPGDEIYGTVRVGNYRRYVKTNVLAHWQTVSRAYRITLGDGTKLIASADHRFLSNRGWKHVIGAEQGPLQRPFLTTSNSLLGMGRFADQPKHNEDYMRGYLCGMIRGDGHISWRGMTQNNGRQSATNTFRLALADTEALQRARDYLEALGLTTHEFVFQKATAARRQMTAIAASGHVAVNRILQIIAWPGNPPDEWGKGFLAGIFDAEGSCSQGILRISNTDEDMLRWLSLCLAWFGFNFVIEGKWTDRGKPIVTIRIPGDLAEQLRFFHMVDPAITRKRDIVGRALKCKADLRVVSIEDLGFDMPMYDITTGTGDFIANGVVSHNCFARVTHTYLDMNAGRDFESKIVVKINAPELLRRELAAKKWKGEHIAMGTATDPYQRAEGRYKLMRGIIGALTDYWNPFSILTKGTLILRDLDLLVDASKVAPVSAALSVGTLDEEAWRLSEPGTPHPRKRIEAVAALNDAGIPTGVMMAPILPGITDDPAQLKEVVRAAIDAGATHVSPIMLHLRPVVKEEYMAWLQDHFPDLVPRYTAMYRKTYGPAADRDALSDVVRGLVDDQGGIRPRPGLDPHAHRRRGGGPADELREAPQQLSLLEGEDPPKPTARIARGRGGR
jgi:DNA repair photolyase